MENLDILPNPDFLVSGETYYLRDGDYYVELSTGEITDISNDDYVL